jgi:hypothetical protein
MNTHMHFMEAFTTYVRAGAGLRARERLSELVAIESQAVIRHEWVAGTDRHRLDWTPVLETSGPGATRVSLRAATFRTSLDIVHDALESVATNITSLNLSGAQTFLVLDIPNLALTPAVRLAGSDVVAGATFLTDT